MFYIMGGNKVAPPKKAGAAGPGATGKTYSGKPAGSSGIGAGAAPKKFGGGGGASSADAEKYE